MPLHPIYQRTLGALHFLSIIRMGNPGPFEPKGMVPYFPVVGLIIGGLVALFDFGASFLWGGDIIAILDVVVLAILSGALHLDGLADSADGIFSHRGRERALEIMKDSRVGVMGVVVVVLGLGLKMAGIAGIEHNRGLILVMAPALSRSGIIAAMKWLPYGRPQGGTGKTFFDSEISWRALGGIFPLAIMIMMAGWQGVLVLSAFIGITWGMISYFRRQMGCITGDMLGAMIEITETGLFLIAAVKLW